MYFFAFPLLLLVASTVCASPVHIDKPERIGTSRTIAERLRANVMAKKGKFDNWAYKSFHGQVTKIEEWSNPDEVVERASHLEVRLKAMIKRVELRTVVPEGGLTKEEQLFHELDCLEAVRQLDCWDEMDEKSKDGKTKTKIYYIGITKIGVPASRTPVRKEDRPEARELGLYVYRKRFGIEVDEAHSRDDNDFSFPPPGAMIRPDLVPPSAYPRSLRYAKIVNAEKVVG